MEQAPSWKRISYDVVIRESHLDSFGHVNNAVYLQLFEEARWQFITEGGYGYREIQELQVGPTIVEVKLSFRKELRLRQKIRIESQVLEYSGKLGTMIQEIKNEAGDLCTVMEMRFGLFDMKARKLVTPTEKWLHAVGKLN